jgi:hypothetical protein
MCGQPNGWQILGLEAAEWLTPFKTDNTEFDAVGLSHPKGRDEKRDKLLFSSVT